MRARVEPIPLPVAVEVNVVVLSLLLDIAKSLNGIERELVRLNEGNVNAPRLAWHVGRPIEEEV